MRRNTAAAVISAINVIPMADIMLVLLIIFMVITPLMGPSIPVELAATANPREMKEAEKDDAMIVAVTRDGTIFFGAKQISLANLRERLSERRNPRSDTVFVKADNRAKFGMVVRVVDEVRGAGIEQLRLLTTRAVPGEKRPRSQSWE